MIRKNYPNLRLSTLLIVLTLGGALAANAQITRTLPEASGAGFPAYPLKLSSNRRYLVDQNNKPFLIVGDTPQGLMSRLSVAQANWYFANREAHGFNTLGWIDVACAGRDYPRDTDGSTYDGIRPFTGYLPGGKDYEHYDLSKPNEVYFARLDEIVRLAAKHGLLVFIDPMETVGWLPTLRNNGVKADYAYGQYLGRRYRRFPNVAWMNGNDFGSWQNPSNDAVVRAVAEGIKSADPKALQTLELLPPWCSSLDDRTWVPILSLDGTYVYGPTYIKMLHSYNQRPVLPTFLLEAHYDLENVGRIPDYGTPAVLRREEYWTMLSGGTGQFYGNHYTWSFAPGWQSHIDTVGVTQLTIWKNFFTSLPWWKLVPDQGHKVVTAGLGNYGTWQTRVSQSTHCAAASTPDGSYVVAYMPTARTITVNMAALKAPAAARWFDPTNGKYKTIPGGPFANTGARQFTPPAKNSSGASDWVLLLEASSSAP